MNIWTILILVSIVFFFIEPCMKMWVLSDRFISNRIEKHSMKKILIITLITLQLLHECNGHFYSQNDSKLGEKNCFCEVRNWLLTEVLFNFISIFVFSCLFKHSWRDLLTTVAVALTPSIFSIIIESFRDSKVFLCATTSVFSKWIYIKNVHFGRTTVSVQCEHVVYERAKRKMFQKAWKVVTIRNELHSRWVRIFTFFAWLK